MEKTIAAVIVAGFLVYGAAAANCHNGFMNGKDLFGGDLQGIRNGWDNPQPTQSACCAQCVETPGCFAITWNEIYGDCWLKGKGFKKASNKKNFVSKQLIPDKCLDQYTANSEIDGTLITRATYTLEPSKEYCCETCTKTTGCVAMTYDEIDRGCRLYTKFVRFIQDFYSLDYSSKKIPTTRPSGD